MQKYELKLAISKLKLDLLAENFLRVVAPYFYRSARSVNKKVTRGVDDASSCIVLVLERNDVRPSALLINKNKKIATVD